MSIDSETQTTWGVGRPGFGFGELLLRKLLASLACGRITIVTPSQGHFEHHASAPGPHATLVLHRWRAVRRFVTHGDFGFSEAYLDGDWSSPDLATLLELAASNIAQFDSEAAGFFVMRQLNRLRHRLRANTRAGSRKNISFHYDLGNAFYQRWLDKSMTYSSALYQRSDQSLEDAQDAKLDRIVELLDLKEGSHVLEIGCGWGALAIRMAQRKALVRGLTLSSEQLSYARERCEREGLQNDVTLELTDYRDVGGQYDRIASIEMLEAVGERYWPIYFSTLHDRLKAGGIAVLQVITIDDTRFDNYRNTTDFIQRHIFPGGMLPTKEIVIAQAEAAGLTLVATERFGESYALTLEEWRRRFGIAWPEIARMGFPARFRRLWEFYLSYCEAGFRAGTIDVGLFVVKRMAP